MTLLTIKLKAGKFMFRNKEVLLSQLQGSILAGKGEGGSVLIHKEHLNYKNHDNNDNAEDSE